MPLNKLRIEVSDELAEKLEDQSQGESIPRGNIVQLALEKYYSPQTQETEQLRIDNIHKAELLAAKDQELQELRSMLEELRGEYALATIKLLPAAEKIMTPWWKRIFRR
jgi:serine phosphatase RsbU (regulator of sigma subunit)